MSLEERIITIIKENMEEEQNVTPDTDLRKDLDIDSFGILMIVNAIEEEFAIGMDESELDHLCKVSDLIRLIREKRKGS